MFYQKDADVYYIWYLGFNRMKSVNDPLQFIMTSNLLKLKFYWYIYVMVIHFFRAQAIMLKFFENFENFAMLKILLIARKKQFKRVTEQYGRADFGNSRNAELYATQLLAEEKMDCFYLISDHCFPSYRNESIDLHFISIDWFLYDGEHWSLMG